MNFPWAKAGDLAVTIAKSLSDLRITPDEAREIAKKALDLGGAVLLWLESRQD